MGHYILVDLGHKVEQIPSAFYGGYWVLHTADLVCPSGSSGRRSFKLRTAVMGHIVPQ